MEERTTVRYATGWRNRDDNPNDTRPICPEFLKDSGCNGGTMHYETPHQGGKTSQPEEVEVRLGAEDEGEYPPDADYAYEEDEEYEEGTTWPEEEDDVPQYDGATAYLHPCTPEDSCGNPLALLSSPKTKSLTPILDTGASHCLLPVAHLTSDEAELASRVHLRVANGALTRAWSGGTPRLILTEDNQQYELLRATLWNSLPCITEHELKALVEALTTATLSTRVWRKAAQGRLGKG
eukprot:1839690-Amphidinium_carterae.1